MSKTPPIPKLRKLLFKFYQENDPVILQQGFDINGLVQYTSQKGIDVLNRMLQGRYGKVIDPDEDLGSATQNFNRMSMGMAQSTFIQSKEQEFRKKLFDFFSKHDPSMTTPARADGFDKLVKFAMLNGVEKLNEKLRMRYNDGIDGEMSNEVQQEALDVNNGAFGNNGLNPFKLDVNRLREDLKLFFIAVEDVEQLEVLDQQTDFACEVGIDEFNKMQEQYYGMTLNAFLEGEGRPIHENQVAKKVEPPAPARPVNNSQRPLPTAPAVQDYSDDKTEYEIVEDVEEVPLPVVDYDRMTDNEIYQELEAFYDEQDPENKGNLPQVVQLAKNLGREALTEKLYEIYQVELQPIKRTQKKIVERKVALPKKKLTPLPAEPIRNLPPIPSQSSRSLPKPPGLGDSFNRPPPVEEIDEYQPPPMPAKGAPPPMREIPKFGVGAPGGMQAELAGAIAMNQNKQKDGVIRENRWQPPREEEEKIPEFLRKQRGMKERINAGKARVRDAAGNIMEINILIDVCKNYDLDVMTGICKCGFAKNDHWAINTKR